MPELNDFSHLIEEPDFDEAPPANNFSYSPEELLQKMGRAAWEYEQASRKIRKLEVSRTVRIAKTMVILSSRKLHLLTNEKIREHLTETFAVDPKFKWTGELYNNFIHLEHQAILDEYVFYERVAKQAIQDYQHWQQMLSYHQTMTRKESLELSTLRGTNLSPHS